MPIILAAIIEALIYLASVPLCGAVFLSTEGGVRFGVGVSAFERRTALRRARRGGHIRKGRGKAEHGLPWGVIRRLRGARVRLQGRLGLGDAAATAVACGALRALAGPRVSVDVAPVFDGRPCVELTGMVRLRSGEIMGAMAMRQIDKIRGRIGGRKGNRSRASGT